MFLVLQIGSGVFFVAEAGAEDLVRIAGLLLLTPFIWKQSRHSQPIYAFCNSAFRMREEALFQRFLVGYLLWALASTFVHYEVVQFVTHLGGAVCLMIVVRVLASDGGVAVARLLPVVLGSAVALSLGIGLLDPTQGLAGGRLRGLFVNANLLAFYSFLALITGLLLVRVGFASLVLSAISIAAVVWTGSRTAAIASATAILLLALFGNRRSRWFVLAALGLVALVLIGVLDLGPSPLFRSLDTRDGSLDEAVRVLSLSPLLGLGFGGSGVEIASTPLRAVVEGGTLALIAVVVMYLLLLREAQRRTPTLVAVAAAAIISSFGEAWFLSAIGPMTLLFVSLWIGISARSLAIRGPKYDGYPPSEDFHVDALDRISTRGDPHHALVATSRGQRERNSEGS